jgi:hypothetical protein
MSSDDEFVHRIEAAVAVLRRDTSVNPFRDDAIEKTGSPAHPVPHNHRMPDLQWPRPDPEGDATMKMREYVDGIQGAGSWDNMHDRIAGGHIGGWSMPPVDVDGMRVNIFPGTDREVTLEAVQAEIRKVLRPLPDGAVYVQDDPPVTGLQKRTID